MSSENMISSEWLLESEDDSGAIFYWIDPEGSKFRVRVRVGDYQIIDKKVFVRLGSEPEWFDPPPQCSIK